MSYHLQVLCSLVRLARRSTNVTESALLARAGGSPTTLTAALKSLESLGLVTLNIVENQRMPRLTLDGLALGTATSSAIASNASNADRAESESFVERRSAGSVGRRMRAGVRASSASSTRTARASRASRAARAA